jgi:hypothetical protein
MVIVKLTESTTKEQFKELLDTYREFDISTQEQRHLFFKLLNETYPQAVND